MIKSLIVTSLLGMVGCVSATIDVADVCSNRSLGTIPASPVAGIKIPPHPFSREADYSDVAKMLTTVADTTTLNVTEFSLISTSNLKWVSKLDVTVKGETPDVPEVLLAQYVSDGSDPGNSINLQVKLSDEKMTQYLTHKVTLTYLAEGTAPTEENEITNVMCLNANGSFDKSL